MINLTKTRMQFNFRTNFEIEFLLEEMVTVTGKRKTDVIQQAIYSYAKDVLSPEQFDQCILKAAHERILKSS